MTDLDGYPTAEELEEIATWHIGSRADLAVLWAYVQSLWRYPDRFVKKPDGQWYVSTGGWSGNEDVITALQHNMIFWALCWQQSRRGGHYIFKFPDIVR